MHNAMELLRQLTEIDPELVGLQRVRSASARCALDQVPSGSAAPARATDHSGSWQEKLARYWNMVQASKHGSVNRVKSRVIVKPEWLRYENLATAFQFDGDLLPRIGSVCIDAKMIHPLGVVACCKLVPVKENGLRGLLGSGAEGLLRASNGNSSSSGSFAPGVALKFPRTGIASADMLFGASFDHAEELKRELEEKDFFAVCLRTWLGEIPTDARYRDVRTLFWMFGRMREEHTGCQAFAERALSPLPLCTHSQEGVPDQSGLEDPVGLTLVPTCEIQKLWEDAWRQKGRREDFRGAFLRLEGRAPVDAYSIEARMANGESRAVGSLQLTTPFIASRCGDAELCFRHPPQCPDSSLTGI